MKRKIITILMSFLVLGVVFTGISIADDNNNSDANGHSGPAPNSGDCIPDGSGYDTPNGPNGDGNSGNGHGGPAPNSGDGIPDGPGW